MTRTQKPVVCPRKKPSQTRSAQLVVAILQGAARVLVRDGAHRFTTARVAEAAGVSVGSLYQYFPNKEAILFGLQTEEWQQTMGELRRILSDSRMSPLGRVRVAVRTFFQSECDEAAFRSALEEAAPLYREAPESRAHVEEGRALMEGFMKELLPSAPTRDRAFAADLAGTLMSSVGKAISSQNRSRAEVDKFAEAVGEMLCAYLESRIGAGAAVTRPAQRTF